jgi:hypothetical protein
MIERYSRIGPARGVDMDLESMGNSQAFAPGTINPSLLDDSEVSMIGDADAMGSHKIALQGNIFSSVTGVAPSPARAESTNMDRCVNLLSMACNLWTQIVDTRNSSLMHDTNFERYASSICLSDIAENTYNKNNSTFGMSQDSCVQGTPQKAFAHACTHPLPRGPAVEEKGLGVTQDGSCPPAGAAQVPENIEEMARRVAAVCKTGVWKAWRGDAGGLDPIYAISLWHQTQTLLVKCGLVDVLALLLAGVTSELLQQAQRAPSDTKLWLGLDGTVMQQSRSSVIHQSRFSRRHTLLAKSTLGVLINLALNKEGSECCRRVKGKRHASSVAASSPRHSTRSRAAPTVDCSLTL